MNRFKLIQESITGGSNYNSTAIIILFILILIFVLYALLYSYLKKKYNYKTARDLKIRKKDFYAVGKNIGLSTKEVKLLLSFIIKHSIKHPMTCYTSAKVLDELLKKSLTIVEKNKNILENEKDTINNMIFEIKSKIEANTRENTGIRSTHFMAENQKIIIFSRGRGYIYAGVKKIFNDHILVNLISEKITKRVFQINEYAKAYFWRDKDAGYVFETNITGFGDGVKEYKLKHSEKLIRSQKRRYRRVPVNFNGELFHISTKIKNDKKIYMLENDSKTQCKLLDLSVGGMKIMLKDFDENVKMVKINFDINDYKVSIFGKIIRYYYYQEGNKDLTIQFIKISLKDKNIINKFVYNYLPGYS